MYGCFIAMPLLDDLDIKFWQSLSIDWLVRHLYKILIVEPRLFIHIRAIHFE